MLWRWSILSSLWDMNSKLNNAYAECSLGTYVYSVALADIQHIQLYILLHVAYNCLASVLLCGLQKNVTAIFLKRWILPVTSPYCIHLRNSSTHVAFTRWSSYTVLCSHTYCIFSVLSLKFNYEMEYINILQTSPHYQKYVLEEFTENWKVRFCSGILWH